jgi:hypothetical protein
MKNTVSSVQPLTNERFFCNLAIAFLAYKQVICSLQNRQNRFVTRDIQLSRFIAPNPGPPMLSRDPRRLTQRRDFCSPILPISLLCL